MSSYGQIINNTKISAFLFVGVHFPVLCTETRPAVSLNSFKRVLFIFIYNMYAGKYTRSVCFLMFHGQKRYFLNKKNKSLHTRSLFSKGFNVFLR